MKNTGINPVVIKEIRQMAQQCGLVRVILFGSARAEILPK